MENTIREQYKTLRDRILEKEYSYLNAQQKKAVFAPDGPLLILAGAGSGKTTVLVSKIAYLIKYGNIYDSDFVPDFISENDIMLLNYYLESKDEKIGETAVKLLAHNRIAPWSILAITFTNKAAGELKERLENSIGPSALDIWAATFHSACVRILRQEIEHVGYNRYFTIYDTDDSKRIIKECISRLNLDEKVYNPRSVLSIISNAKNSGLSPKELKQEMAFNPRMVNISNLYAMYIARLKAADALDFDDIILVTVKILEEFPEVRAHWSERFSHVLVDEYQDTNSIQYKLVSLLRKPDGNLTVVGDDDQSIYKFRGATIENILSFEKQFRNVTVIKLERNYRSTQNILNAANGVIKNNLGRKSKTLWTDNGSGEKITLFNAYDESHEAGYIASAIAESVYEKGLSYKQFAVLYRTNAQSRAIENAMRLKKIPAKVIGGLSFYDRKEVKDILSYMCLILNPKDNLRLKRIINEPKRGIGETSLKNLERIAEETGESMLAICGKANSFTELRRAADKLISFYNMIMGLAAFLDDNPLNLLIDEILVKSGYELALADDESGKERLENISELNTAVINYIEEEEEPSLFGFLEKISLVSDIDSYEAGDDVVSLMTLHSAKGLEFDYVFIPGAEEGLFPSSMSLEEPGGIEEERRLCYVGITRAKKELTLLHAKRRTIYGTTTYPQISRFIGEIPKELIEEKGVSDKESTDESIFEFVPSFNLKTASKEQSESEKKKITKQNFVAGEIVFHRIFGEGRILSVKDMGSDDLLEIQFKAGIKKIMAGYANLKKIN